MTNTTTVASNFRIHTDRPQLAIDGAPPGYIRQALPFRANVYEVCTVQGDDVLMSGLSHSGAVEWAKANGVRIVEDDTRDAVLQFMRAELGARKNRARRSCNPTRIHHFNTLNP